MTSLSFPAGLWTQGAEGRRCPAGAWTQGAEGFPAEEATPMLWFLRTPPHPPIACPFKCARLIMKSYSFRWLPTRIRDVLHAPLNDFSRFSHEIREASIILHGKMVLRI